MRSLICNIVLVDVMRLLSLSSNGIVKVTGAPKHLIDNLNAALAVDEAILYQYDTELELK